MRSRCRGKEGRSLSELMRLHAEKETVAFSAEEASRVADVLKKWVSMMPFSHSLHVHSACLPFANVHVDLMTLYR